MSKNTKLTIFIVLLILIVMGAGYLIKKGASVTQVPTDLQQRETAQSDSVVEILTFQSQGATKEARTQFRELVSSLAQEGSTVTINADCSPDPFVLKIKVDESITVQNKDSVEHRLSLREESTEIVILPADSTTFLISDFVERDPDPRGSVVKYRCDRVRSGVFYITQ